MAARSAASREQEGSAEEADGETAQDQEEENPCCKPSENAWALVWFVNGIKVMRR